MKPKRGRPKVYRQIGHLALRGEKAELARVRAFARWLKKRDGKRIPLVRVLLDALFESPDYRAFSRSRRKS